MLTRNWSPFVVAIPTVNHSKSRSHKQQGAWYLTLANAISMQGVFVASGQLLPAVLVVLGAGGWTQAAPQEKRKTVQAALTVGKSLWPTAQCPHALQVHFPLAFIWRFTVQGAARPARQHAARPPCHRRSGWHCDGSLHSCHPARHAVKYACALLCPQAPQLVRRHLPAPNVTGLDY